MFLLPTRNWFYSLRAILSTLPALLTAGDYQLVITISGSFFSSELTSSGLILFNVFYPILEALYTRIVNTSEIVVYCDQTII